MSAVDPEVTMDGNVGRREGLARMRLFLPWGYVLELNVQAPAICATCSQTHGLARPSSQIKRLESRHLAQWNTSTLTLQFHSFH